MSKNWKKLSFKNLPLKGRFFLKVPVNNSPGPPIPLFIPTKKIRLSWISKKRLILVSSTLSSPVSFILSPTGHSWKVLDLSQQDYLIRCWLNFTGSKEKGKLFITFLLLPRHETAINEHCFYYLPYCSQDSGFMSKGAYGQGQLRPATYLGCNVWKLRTAGSTIDVLQRIWTCLSLPLPVR